MGTTRTWDPSWISDADLHFMGEHPIALALAISYLLIDYDNSVLGQDLDTAFDRHFFGRGLYLDDQGENFHARFLAIYDPLWTRDENKQGIDIIAMTRDLRTRLWNMGYLDAAMAATPWLRWLENRKELITPST